jgi:hypothetical protein
VGAKKEFMFNATQTIQSYGIVLKNFSPLKQKCLVLDRERGPIEVVQTEAMASRLCNGTLFSCHMSSYKGSFVIRSMDVIEMPFAWARQDILFLHHLLELVRFFLPVESANRPVFELLQTLYTSQDRSDQMFKKMAIAQFFLYLGSWPETELWKNPIMLRGLNIYFGGHCNLSLEQYSEAQDSLRTGLAVFEPELDAWLLACVAEHPQVGHMKTINFLMSV